jgi:putative transposase
VVAAGLPHHVTQRGNYRQNVFSSDTDRLTYLGLLREYSQPARLRLIGYCLMTNHVHLIVVPERADSLARGLGQAHCRYAHAVHARLHATGHLW